MSLQDSDFYNVGGVSTGIKYFKSHCTEVECPSPFRKFLLFLFYFLKEKGVTTVALAGQALMNA